MTKHQARQNDTLWKLEKLKKDLEQEQTARKVDR